MGKTLRRRLDSDGDWSRHFSQRRPQRLPDINDDDDDPYRDERRAEDAARERDEQEAIEHLEAERDWP